MREAAMAGVVLVTGGGRGIGAATSLLAAERGYSVCVNYHANAARAEQVVDRIRSAGGQAAAVQADVAEEADVARLFEAADRLGPLTGLVNNAGMLLHAGRLDETVTGPALDRLWRTNLTGPFLCAREAIRRMSTRHGGKGGAIVNVSSVHSRLGGPGTYVSYAATKGGMDSFTFGLALEVAGEGVRVNAVRPGLIDTEIHALGGMPDRVRQIGHTVPIGRAGRPEEVAETILWLLSPQASYLAGSLVDVSGGR
jgi:NAD(P)-dependent dehydrogenase (short-subunit alcohol dehydrogenase family)